MKLKLNEIKGQLSPTRHLTRSTCGNADFGAIGDAHEQGSSHSPGFRQPFSLNTDDLAAGRLFTEPHPRVGLGSPAYSCGASSRTKWVATAASSSDAPPSMTTFTGSLPKSCFTTGWRQSEARISGMTMKKLKMPI